MSKPTNKSIYLEGVNGQGQKFWFRIYHRGMVDVYLANFVPTRENGILSQLERVIDIQEISGFDDAGMAVIKAKKGVGVRVCEIIEILKLIEFTGNLYKVKIKRHGKELDA